MRVKTINTIINIRQLSNWQVNTAIKHGYSEMSSEKKRYYWHTQNNEQKAQLYTDARLAAAITPTRRSVARVFSAY